jgi:hypothetical protein
LWQHGVDKSYERGVRDERRIAVARIFQAFVQAALHRREQPHAGAGF